MRGDLAAVTWNYNGIIVMRNYNKLAAQSLHNPYVQLELNRQFAFEWERKTAKCNWSSCMLNRWSMNWSTLNADISCETWYWFGFWWITNAIICHGFTPKDSSSWNIRIVEDCEISQGWILQVVVKYFDIWHFVALQYFVAQQYFVA